MPEARLRQLSLNGFKTFARHTDVLLSAGVTGIVGPNGSGKSNLADAVRWVMGEQSLQHIRSKKTEDVIFAGGLNRPPMGAAEVTLTLDNTSGWIPLDFSEVTITRRAYRSGDNEYFINGSRVRLRDVIDLRSRAGFGQSSYSVIGQGLVDAVLSQRPEERRLLFEEAAGIRHYQAKRDQTLDQLAATRQNLVRVQDIVAEMAPRLESLRRQSEKAQQHAELSQQLRALHIRWYAARHRQVSRQAAEAEALLAEVQKQLDAAAAEARAVEIQRQNLEADRQAAEQALSRETQRLAELNRRREQLEGQAALAGDKLQFMQQQGQEAGRELAELAAAREGLIGQRQELTASIQQLRARGAAVARELREAQQAAAGRGGDLRRLEQRLQEARDALAAQAASQEQRRREVSQLAERTRELQQQANQHRQDVARKEGLVRALEEKHTALQRELQSARTEEEHVSGQTEEARLQAAAAAKAAADQAARLDGLRRAQAELSTRLNLLQELQTNLEGLAEGARRLLRSGHPAVLGGLSEGLTVEPGFERAVAAALGHKLDAVLISGSDAAAAVLRESEVGEVTLVIPQAAGAPATAAGGEPERMPRPLSSTVQGSQAAVSRLLQGWLLCDEIEQALACAQQGWRAVTRDGIVAEPDGTITQRAVSAGEAVLKRQRSLEELASQLDAGALAVVRAEDDQQRLAAAAKASDQRLKALEEEGRRHAANRQRIMAQMRDLAQQMQAARAQVDWLAALERQTQEQATGLDMRRTALLAEVDQAAERMPELQSIVNGLQRELEGLRRAGDDDARLVADLQLRQGVTRQELQHAEATLAELEQRLAAATRQMEARQRRVNEHASTLSQLQAEIDTAQAELDGVRRGIGDQEGALPPLRNRLARLSDELKLVRRRESEVQEQQAELDKRSYRLSFDSQRRRDELESLAASVLDELQLTLDVLPEPDPDQPEPSKREVDALKARLAALGPVNPGALEEFREVQERHAFLTSQQADLEQAAQRLQAVISELEELTRRQFLETFEQVSAEFARFFELMFNGGQVQMYLTDPGNVHTTGVEILAQPPGKRLQSLPLLSGGERALVATGLLFAILSTKPVPFCLLDEVDAALDEANVKRFCQALSTLAEQTQFVVITHNRETMAMADALYGVSMAQNGISRLVSLRLPREDRWARDEGLESSEALSPAHAG